MEREFVGIRRLSEKVYLGVMMFPDCRGKKLFCRGNKLETVWEL